MATDLVERVTAVRGLNYVNSLLAITEPGLELNQAILKRLLETTESDNVLQAFTDAIDWPQDLMARRQHLPESVNRWETLTVEDLTQGYRFHLKLNSWVTTACMIALQGASQERQFSRLIFEGFTGEDGSCLIRTRGLHSWPETTTTGNGLMLSHLKAHPELYREVLKLASEGYPGMREWMTSSGQTPPPLDESSPWYKFFRSV